jgi:hypothetical protein
MGKKATELEAVEKNVGIKPRLRTSSKLQVSAGALRYFPRVVRDSRLWCNRAEGNRVASKWKEACTKLP